MSVAEVPPPPTVTAQAFPPAQPTFFPPFGGYGPPPNLVIPPIPGVLVPPCIDNPDTPENECGPPPPPEQPPPPTEVPEPGAILILMVGAAVMWATGRRRQPAPAKR